MVQVENASQKKSPRRAHIKITKIFDHTKISQWKCDVKKRKFWAINWTTTVKNTKNSLGTTMQAQIHETMKVFVAALFSQLALLLLLGFLFYTHTAYRHLHMKSICCFFLELLLHTDLNTDAWHFIWVLLCCVCDVRDFFLATFQPLGFYIPFRFFRLRWFCFRPRWCFLQHSSTSSCFFLSHPHFCNWSIRVKSVKIQFSWFCFSLVFFLLLLVSLVSLRFFMRSASLTVVVWSDAAST